MRIAITSSGQQALFSKVVNLEVNLDVDLFSLGRYKGGAGVILHPIMLVEVRKGSKVMAVCFIPDAN